MITQFLQSSPTQCDYCHAMRLRQQIEEDQPAVLQIRAPQWTFIALCRHHAESMARELTFALATRPHETVNR